MVRPNAYATVTVGVHCRRHYVTVSEVGIDPLGPHCWLFERPLVHCIAVLHGESNVGKASQCSVTCNKRIPARLGTTYLHLHLHLPHSKVTV